MTTEGESWRFVWSHGWGMALAYTELRLDGCKLNSHALLQPRLSPWRQRPCPLRRVCHGQAQSSGAVAELACGSMSMPDTGIWSNGGVADRGAWPARARKRARSAIEPLRMLQAAR